MQVFVSPAAEAANMIDPNVNPMQPTKYELSIVSDVLRGLAAENEFLERKLVKNEALIHSLLNPKSGQLPTATQFINQTDELLRRAIDSLGEGGASSLSVEDLLEEFRLWLQVRRTISVDPKSNGDCGACKSTGSIDEEDLLMCRVCPALRYGRHSSATSTEEHLEDEMVKERIQFEAWCKKHNIDTALWNPSNPIQGYVHSRTQDKWIGWIAAANERAISAESLQKLANVMAFDHAGCHQTLIDLATETMAQFCRQETAEHTSRIQELEIKLDQALQKSAVEDTPAAYEYDSLIGDRPLSRSCPTGPDAEKWQPIYRLKKGVVNHE